MASTLRSKRAARLAFLVWNLQLAFLAWKLIGRSLAPYVRREDTAAALAPAAPMSHPNASMADPRPTPHDGGPCDRIVLYASDLIATKTGVAHRTANYMLAVVVAVLTDSALVVLDPPAGDDGPWAEAGGSPFGCPHKNGGAACGGLPTGVGRILQVPRWLSRGCDVPCKRTHSYDDWYGIANNTGRKSNFASTTCANEDEGANATVLAIGRVDMKYYWMDRLRPRLFPRQRMQRQWVTDWSTRMGATENEVDAFLDANATTSPIDYIGALVARAGIRYQPWVSEGVAASLRRFEGLSLLPPTSEGAPLRLLSTSPNHRTEAFEYDAMHIRRGDRVNTTESMKAVEEYWVERGYGPIDVTKPRKRRELIMAAYPTNYVPFAQYWHAYATSAECSNASTATDSEPPTYVYIATDDIETVRDEIANLTRAEGAGHLTRCGSRVEFLFYPQEQHAKHIHASRQTTSRQPQLANETLDRGHEQYQRTISAITDMHLLSQSNVFVGEYQSYWGRLLRAFRTSLREDGVLATKYIVIAWGKSDSPPPW